MRQLPSLRSARVPKWAPWAAAGAATAILAVLVVFRAFSASCPAGASCVTLGELQDGGHLPEAIHVYDRFGDPLADFGGPRRHALPEERIPERLRQAWVAVEDRRFWSHEGLDVRGIVRATVENLRSGGIAEGASTIPMQLVRTLWSESLSDKGRWRRKVIEARMAPKLIDELGHERVLALYLNSIYLGNGLYGVEAAARHYFGKPADSLDLAETATLVGMTRAPERYEPRRNPERARARRDVVLGVLARTGVVSAEEAEEARGSELRTTEEPEDLYHNGFITAAVARAIGELPPEIAGRPGLRVFTTIDPRVQRMGERALRNQIASIERGDYGKMEASEDSTRRLQGAAVALDPRSGAVRAWVGGRNFADSQFDRVAQARRQVGSLVKPFIIASALESGIGILDLVSTDTLSIQVTEGLWSPADHVESLVMPIREALVRSSNRAAVHLGRTLGVERIRTVAGEVGIEAPIPPVPSVFVGSFEASLLEMTGAFAAFGNGGFRIEPYLIERIEDERGTVLWERTRPDRLDQPLSEVSAFVVLDAMRDVVDRGTGWGVRNSGYYGPAAGKTGTTNEGRDAWFVGLVPDLAAGVWLGFDWPRPIVPDGSGGTLASPAWGRWMKAVADSVGDFEGSWVPPLGVERVRYDVQTGTPVPQDCREDDKSFRTSYVPTGSYGIQRCPGGFGDWLRRTWRSLIPGKVEPVKPIVRGGRRR